MGRGTYTAEGIQAVADALRVNPSITCCNVLNNNLDVAAAQLLVEAVKDRDVSLAGISRDQTSADFNHEGLKSADAVLLASDLSKAGVSASITEVRQVQPSTEPLPFFLSHVLA